MLQLGQEIITKYGAGVVVGLGRIKPHVYVRVRSRANDIFMLDESEVHSLEESQNDNLETR